MFVMQVPAISKKNSNAADYCYLAFVQLAFTRVDPHWAALLAYKLIFRCALVTGGNRKGTWPVKYLF